MRPEDQLKEQPIQPVLVGGETVRDQDKIMLVLSYLGIFALIPLLTVKDSPYVQWHAKNGLVLGIGGWLAVAIFSALVGWIWIIGPLLAFVAWVGLLVLHVMAIVKALAGNRWRIPGVSDLAEKF